MTTDERSFADTDLLALLPHLKAFAWSLTRNGESADDLVQDTVVRALGSAHSFESGTNLKSWMFTILRNQFYNELRRRRPLLTLHIPGMAEPRVPPRQEAPLEFDDFRRAFGQLSADKREVLILVGSEGLSYDETAQICGCAQGTIKSRVSRARLELRALLEQGQSGAISRNKGTWNSTLGGRTDRAMVHAIPQ